MGERKEEDYQYDYLVTKWRHYNRCTSVKKVNSGHLKKKRNMKQSSKAQLIAREIG
jgi:hypothetical protein